MIYYVTIRVEETLEIDDVCSEAEAIKHALQQFDVINVDPEIVEVWSDKDD